MKLLYMYNALIILTTLSLHGRNPSRGLKNLPGVRPSCSAM